jgi:hypothetical protein
MYVIYESFLLYVYRTESQTNHGRVQDNDDWPVADAPDEEPLANRALAQRWLLW